MQKNVANFMEEMGWQSDPNNRYIDLVSEIGELGKEILLATNYGKEELTLITSPSMEDEMGDCLFSLLALCTTLDIDAENALSASMQKYRNRNE